MAVQDAALTVTLILDTVLMLRARDSRFMVRIRLSDSGLRAYDLGIRV